MWPNLRRYFQFHPNLQSKNKISVHTILFKRDNIDQLYLIHFFEDWAILGILYEAGPDISIYLGKIGIGIVEII